MKTNFFERSWWTSWLCSMFLLTASSQADVLDHWTTNQVSDSFRLLLVTHADGLYVAYGVVADYGVIMTSPDAVNWTVRLNGQSGTNGLSYPIGLVHTGSRFFAFGGFGVSAFSTNGANWTAFPLRRAYGVAFGNSSYRAVIDREFSSLQDVFIYLSPTLGWSPQNVNGFGARLGDIAYGAGLFVALGVVQDSGFTWTASGTTWTKRSIPPGGRSISFLNGLFIVPANPGTNLISANGLDWAIVNTGLTNALTKVNYANGLYFALAGTSGRYLATSVDATNWLQYPQLLPGSGLSIATDGSRFVTVSGIGQNSIPPFTNSAFVYRSGPLVKLRNGGVPGQVELSGLIGRSYQIESSDILTNSNWEVRFTGQLPSNPYIWSDPTAATSPQRYYRAALLP